MKIEWKKFFGEVMKKFTAKNKTYDDLTTGEKEYIETTKKQYEEIKKEYEEYLHKTEFFTKLIGELQKTIEGHTPTKELLVKILIKKNTLGMDASEESNQLKPFLNEEDELKKLSAKLKLIDLEYELWLTTKYPALIFFHCDGTREYLVKDVIDFDYKLITKYDTSND
jgi:hypothetical protein